MSVLIAGAGPAGLMAADVLSRASIPVIIWEKRPAAGRKLLIAGSSGLNISYDTNAFPDFYSTRSDRMAKIFHEFGREQWFQFIEDLGLKTFLGTSRRYFLEGFTAAPLIKAWIDRLKDQGVQFSFNQQIENLEDGWLAKNTQGEATVSKAVCFAVGGGSYESDMPPTWQKIFRSHGVEVSDFEPSNVGFETDWKPEFIGEAEGKPLKNITLITARGSKRGELMVTRYGLEGPPIYYMGAVGEAWLDLKPELSLDEIRERLKSGKENLAPLRRIKKYLAISEAAQALLFHYSSEKEKSDLNTLVEKIKWFPIELKRPRPLAEAISSKNGLCFDELDEKLMVKKMPGVFCAGEMIDWDAPTGGFLLQASVSTGFVAGKGILKYLKG